MAKFAIPNRYTQISLFECESDRLRDAVEKAVKQCANLGGAYLGGAYLRGADLGGAYLRGADLGGADLGGADLGGADLGGAYLGGANFRGADLGGADLGGAYLRGADLEGANLRGAYLRYAYLRGADLGGADNKKLTLVGDRPLLVIGPIGSRLDYLCAYLTDGGIYIKAGCFFGSRDTFIKATVDTHKDNKHAQEYKAALVLIEKYAELWTPQEVKK